jgi:hypothetical protein
LEDRAYSVAGRTNRGPALPADINDLIPLTADERAGVDGRVVCSTDVDIDIKRHIESVCVNGVAVSG